MTAARSVRTRIRAMEAADVPEVCAVDRRCFATPWSAESFLAELAGA